MVQEEVVVAEKECVAVRLLAEYPDLDYYIYLMFFIDKDNLKLIGMEMLVSNNYDFFNLLNNTNDLKELYKHIEFAVSTENNLIFPSDKLKEDINKILKDRVNRFNIVNYLIKNDIVPVIDIFSDTLNISMDFNIGIYDIAYKYYSVNDIKFFIENTKDDIQNKKIDFDVYNFFSNAEYEMINEEEDIADKYQIINASLVVSPVNGTPINEIKIGDMVVVSINSNLYEENMIYIESKGKKDEYSKALVPGEIIEKVVTDENVKLTIKLSDEYCAVIEETEPIKLRIFDPDKDTYIAPVVSMDERLNLVAKFFDNLSIFQLIMYGLGITSLFILGYILYIIINN
ncbi:hypothetical protein [Brachyspira catarrhinii]|uniref:DUF4899 domain-containing protein n=1 Tax=Brachyspira catarrhinii TaxID=2528966 RepID=A0ABY2TSA8_9SPIR|nr:hypothetical protein [Brachyspira catarrhinii]TKZ35752.1 hypothetical protein EZH24_03615 [Brachyspira catarrhinii]